MMAELREWMIVLAEFTSLLVLLGVVSFFLVFVL